jgi:hypothetical protein
VQLGAILFRLSIPFAAGMLVPLLLSSDERAVAAASGAIAWFLVLWPIAWTPSLLFPHSRAWPIVALLISLWTGFTLLPIAGVTTTELLRDLLHEGSTSWGSKFAEAVVTALPITALISITGWVARRRITFADDPEPQSESSVVDQPYRPSFREKIDAASYAIPYGFVNLGILFVLVLILVRSGKRHGRS